MISLTVMKEVKMSYLVEVYLLLQQCHLHPLPLQLSELSFCCVRHSQR